LIVTVTPTSGSIFAPLERCLWLLGVVIIVLQMCFAHYFVRSIVYNFSFLVEVALLQGWKIRNRNNDILSMLWHQLRVLFQLLGDESHVGWFNNWDNVRTTQCAPRCGRSE
jgi:hypothetical protein